jgi:hypothetical protein
MTRTLTIILVSLLALPAGSSSEPKSTQTVRVQVVFSEVTECGPYTDALYFVVDDPHMRLADFLAAKQPEIAKVKASRVAAFVDRVRHPPAPVEPTKEQLEAEVVEIDRQRASLESRKLELAAAIAAKDAVIKEGESK